MRSPLALAALATVAIPGLDIVRVYQQEHDAYQIAVVVDESGGRWVIRVPRSPAAGADLEAELAFLTALADSEVELPFSVPSPAGAVDIPEGGRAVVHPALVGKQIRIAGLQPGPGLAAELGRAIAALHELPTGIVAQSGQPTYDDEDLRQRHLAELDDIAGTGRVSARLLRRWEEALENIAMWRFTPVVVHGDLAEDTVLSDGKTITGLINWSQTHVGDPADDLAWLVAAAEPDVLDSVLEAYQLRRTELRDTHLVARAELAAEMALGRWLLHGIRSDDEAIIADAVGMLDDLDEVTAAALARAEHEARVLAEVAAADAIAARGVVALEVSRAARPSEEQTIQLDLSDELRARTDDLPVPKSSPLLNSADAPDPDLANAVTELVEVVEAPTDAIAQTGETKDTESVEAATDNIPKTAEFDDVTQTGESDDVAQGEPPS